MTLLFIVLLPSSVMLCLFINISKLSLDNFLLQTTCIAVLLCLIFLFGWNLQTLGMCTRLVFRLISRALIMHEALNAVFKILPSTQSLHFFFFSARYSRKVLNFLHVQILPLATSVLWLAQCFHVSCMVVYFCLLICILQLFLSQVVEEEQVYKCSRYLRQYRKSSLNK